MLVRSFAGAAVAALVFLVGVEVVAQPRRASLSSVAVQEPPALVDMKEARPVEAVGREIMAAIAKEEFDKVYGYLPAWRREGDKEVGPIRIWRLENGWDSWERGLKSAVEAQDPKDKAGLSSLEKFVKATDARRMALFMGLYRIYACEQWETRLGSPWGLSGRQVKYEAGGMGSASLHFINRYNDSLEISLALEGGQWCPANIKLNMPPEMPKKPRND